VFTVMDPVDLGVKGRYMRHEYQGDPPFVERFGQGDIFLPLSHRPVGQGENFLFGKLGRGVEGGIV
jgi:hypothetical protein